MNKSGLYVVNVAASILKLSIPENLKAANLSVEESAEIVARE